MGERKDATAASVGKGGSGQLRGWATFLHHGTNGHGVRKVLGCTDRTGGQTDPAMEAPDPADPLVWASAGKEDRAEKATSTFVPGVRRGKGRGRKGETKP